MHFDDIYPSLKSYLDILWTVSYSQDMEDAILLFSPV